MRKLLIEDTWRKIPPYPHHKDYVYRCSRYFGSNSAIAFLSIARFRVLREMLFALKYQCVIPRDLLIDPTNACNLHCKGCWASDYERTDSLSYEKLDRLLAEAESLGVMDILMTGGEPLVRKSDILALSEKHKKLFFGVFTNATLIDERFADEMAKRKNISMFISIEGFADETDTRRGSGTFDMAVSAMDLLKSRDIGFGFSVCCHANNYETVTSDAFLDFLRAKGAWFGWLFTYLPLGTDADVSLCLSPEQREYVAKQIETYCKKHRYTIIDFANAGHRAYGCVGAGSGFAHINARGDVEPCAFCHYSDANIHEMSLLEALRSPFFRAFRAAQPFTENPLRPCPMMDNPAVFSKLVTQCGACSTHTARPESVDALAVKTAPLAKGWKKTADRLFLKLSSKEKKRYRFLLRGLLLKKRLSGDVQFKKDKK